MSDEEREAPRPMSDRRANGWLVLYGPEFARPYERLRAEVRKLKKELAPNVYAQHPTVMLFVHLRRFIREIVPANPNAADFLLEGDLARFRRGKGHGLPDRYRIIWVFSSTRRVILLLYLNDESTLRKAGAATDPYETFHHLLRQGRVGSDFEENYRSWLAENPGLRDAVIASAGPPPAEDRPSKPRSRRRGKPSP